MSGRKCKLQMNHANDQIIVYKKKWKKQRTYFYNFYPLNIKKKIQESHDFLTYQHGIATDILVSNERKHSHLER